MSPIADPRYSAARRKSVADEARDSQGDSRMEYIKPLIMFVVGVGSVSAWYMFGSSYVDDDGNPISGALLAGFYLVGFVISLAAGVAGLWVASRLWLGGVGFLGLSILRLAGIYGITDLVALFVGDWPLIGLIIRGVVYIGLLMWLFELEATDSIMLAVITFVLYWIAGMAVMMAMMS